MSKVTMPEPIGWITHESIYRLASGGNGSKGTVPIHKSRSYVAKTQVFTAIQAEAYAAAKVREALEEAVQACEARIGTGDPGIDVKKYDKEAQQCADAMRALIPKE